MKKLICVSLLPLCIAFTAVPARSATVTLAFNFVASNFIGLDVFVGAPVDPVTGSFGMTFDDAVPGLKTFDFLNLTINSVAYDETNSSIDYAGGNLYLGGNVDGPTILSFGGSDWRMTIGSDFLTAVSFDYKTLPDNGFNTRTISLQPISAVPLPAALPLFAAGLSAMGFMGWRRKHRAVA